jgi:ribosome-binding protein aMBF1 (putative translation factor)
MSNTERQPSFHATWPAVRAKSPTDELMNSLGHQDWSKVTIGNGRAPTGAARQSTFKPVSASQAVGNKIANSELAGKFKKLAPESRQEIVNIRAANKWSQVDLNQRCSFPVNTIREIESGRLTPTIGQLNTLNRVLKTGLKLI